MDIRSSSNIQFCTSKVALNGVTSTRIAILITQGAAQNRSFVSFADFVIFRLAIDERKVDEEQLC